MGEENKSASKAAAVWAFIKKIAVRVWKYIKIARMELIIMIGFFLIDLISKIIVKNTMPVGSQGRVTIIPFVLNFVYIQNKDAAFGSNFIVNIFGGSEMGARIFFSVFAVAASVGIMLYLIHCRGRNRVLRAALAMFIAGAMGNCIDRMAYGYVVDFIEFVYFGLTIFGRKTFYVFNIADSALVIGVFMLLVYFIFLNRDKDKKKDKKELAPADGEQPEQTDGEVVDIATEEASGGTAENEVQSGSAETIDVGVSDNDVQEHSPNERVVDLDELRGEKETTEKGNADKLDAPSGDKG